MSHKPKTLLTLLAAHFDEQGGGRSLSVPPTMACTVIAVMTVMLAIKTAINFYAAATDDSTAKRPFCS